MVGGSPKRSSRRALPDASGAADARELLLDWRGAQLSLARDERLELGRGAWLLRGFAAPDSERLRADLSAVAAAAPFRHMQTPGGFSFPFGYCGRPQLCVSTTTGATSLVPTGGVGDIAIQRAAVGWIGTADSVRGAKFIATYTIGGAIENRNAYLRADGGG